MSRSEILAAITAIYSGLPDNQAVDDLLDKLEHALPHSEISDLIFWDNRDFTPEQVVEEAFRREAEHTAKAI